jgi:uncharacterized delta-60 repeat protein
MPNLIKYSTTGDTLSLKKGNFYIGVGDVGKGPTEVTGYWNGVDVPSGGYIIHKNKSVNGPAMWLCKDDAEFVYITNNIEGTTFTGATQSLAYYSPMNNAMVFNRNYETITTDSLELLLDAGFTPSYPRSGLTWYDLSYSGNNGTLVNGPTYSNVSGGTITFDGVDDIVNLTSSIVYSSWTLSAWFQFTVQKIKQYQYMILTNNSAGNRVGRVTIEFNYSMTIESINLDSSGNIFVGGRITEYNGNSIALIVKLDPNGTFIPQFNTGLVITQTQTTSDIEIDSNGFVYYVGYNIGNLTKINPITGAQIQRINGVNSSITQSNLVLDEANNRAYIGGWFTSIQGVAAQRIARLNLSAMTIDTTFNTTTGFVNLEDVLMMTLQPDGKLIVGGQFTSYKGQTYNRIIRLNSDASIDTSFVIGTGFNAAIRRNCIALQSDNKIIVGGLFTSYSGVSRNYIIRLNTDGSIDNTFNIGTGFNLETSSVLIQPDGKILVGGQFTTYSGITNVNRIVRLNSNGSRDIGFNSGGVGFGSTGVSALRLQSDGKILCGLTAPGTYNGTSVNELCRLNADGTLDNTFNTGTGFFGAYRLNTQTTYLQLSNFYNSSALYEITSPIAYNWRDFETASSTLLNQYSNFTITKNALGNYVQYWNGQLKNTSSVTPIFSSGVDVNRIGIIKGSLSELIMYRKNLNSSEILQIYQSQFPRYLGENIVTSGLVNYLDAGYRGSLQITTGTTWGDVSGYGRNGTLTNGPTYSTDGGGSIVFDGVDDYVTNIGDVSTFSFIQNTGVFTISAWVKLTDLSIARYFIGNNNGSTVNKGFFLGYQGNTGRLWLAITYGVGGQTTLNQSKVNFFTDNNWVLVTCVGNGTNCQFYKNGVAFDTPNNFTTFSTGNSFAVLDVGRYNAGTADEWKGNIAITQIYNRALSSDEVLQNFNAQKSRFGL